MKSSINYKKNDALTNILEKSLVKKFNFYKNDELNLKKKLYLVKKFVSMGI